MATDRPTPTLVPSPPPSDGNALAVFDTSASDFRVTSPAPMIVTFGEPRTPPVVYPASASVSVNARLIATDPATPTLPPPAPAVAQAPKLSVASPGASAAPVPSTAAWVSRPRIPPAPA